MNKLLSIRTFETSEDRRNFLKDKLKLKLLTIGQTLIEDEEVKNKNIENFIGATQIPLGIAGPLKIKGFKKEIYIPLATTEGALVASTSRGCKVINESGGAVTYIENIGITRGPVFRTNGIEHSLKIKNWIEENFEKISKVAEEISSHLKLKKMEVRFAGKSLFIRFYFDSGDAMGMNMSTIATDKISKFIEGQTKAKCVSVAGNFDIDKKPAWLNFISGRGKKVWAEVIIKKEVVKQVLKTTPEKIVELNYRKIFVGSAMAGSLGFNAHFANIIAAIFAATGQDLGHVVEGSLGITSSEILENGDLYFSVFLPSLEVGTVGGGTGLPTQKEALEIMGVSGSGNVLKFAEIIAATVLAGEISLTASQAEGSLAKAHQKLGRKGR